MNKRTSSFLCLLMISTPCFSQEEKDHRRIHSYLYGDFTINMEGIPSDYEMQSPRRPDTPRPHQNERVPTPTITNEQLTERHMFQLKRTKIKIAAITAVITTLITGGVSLIIALRKCE